MKASIACALLLLGCVAGNEPLVPQPAPFDHQRLQQVRVAHTQLLAQLSEAPAAHVEACRSSAGDCLFQVDESRARLVSSLRLSPCDRADDFRSKSSCVSGQLESSARKRELTDYLALENWCFAQLTACTAGKADQAREATVEARFAARKQELETNPDARAARSGLLLTRARVEYLRATLPPDAAVCQLEGEGESCRAGVETARRALEQSLRQDDYDQADAASRYVALERAEDGCARPELQCLSAAIATYGVFPESRKWVDRNLETLARRQELVARVSPASRDLCVTGLQQQHQAGIVSAYVAYVHEPVLYYRSQLDKAFLTLHQAQVSCLAARPRTSPAKPAVAAQH